MSDKRQKKIEKCQRKIKKFQRKLQKYQDMLTELTQGETVKAAVPVMEAVPPAPVKEAENSGKQMPSARKIETEKPVTRVRRKPPVKKTSKPAEAAPSVTKEEVAAEKPAAVAEKTEQKPRTRTRKSRAAAPVEKKTAKGRQTKSTVSFVLYNCDEDKTPDSRYNRNDETFRDTQLGRRGLWAKLKTEITEGRISLLNNYPMKNIRLELASGDPVSVNQHLKYGLIERI